MKRITTGLMLTAVLALSASMLPASSASAQVSVGISVNFAPPPLPYYQQPILPAPGYIWVPGYWAYGAYGYYWVPGAWVLPPAVGLLWTPGYWAWNSGYYRWYPGYWGPYVGFYGGINYGYGYPGRGYYGGYWNRGRFYYNRAVVNINIRNVYVYNKPVPSKYRGPRVSYNGGKGGSTFRPTKQELAWARERRAGPTAQQMKYRDAALKAPDMRYKNNQGKPPVVTAKPYQGTQQSNQKPATRPTQGNQPRPNSSYPGGAQSGKPGNQPPPQYQPQKPNQGPNKPPQGYQPKPVSYPGEQHSGKPGSNQPPPPEEQHNKKPNQQDNKPKPPPAAGLRTLARGTPAPAWRQEARQAPQNAQRAATYAQRQEKQKNDKRPPA